MSKIYSQTQIANLGMPSKFEVVDVGTDGDYTNSTNVFFTIESTGDGGDIVVVGAEDSVAVTLPSTPAGQPYPGVFKEIKASGTEPNNIVVGFYSQG